MITAVVLLALASPAVAGLVFEKAEYAARREKLMEKIPDGVAIVWGAQPVASYYRYAQNNDFLYLTGVEIPNAVLVVDGILRTSTIVFTSTEDAARSEGISADLVRNPVEYTGIERAMPYENLNAILAAIASRSKVIYTCFRPEELLREASMEKLSTLQRNMTLNIWDGRQTRELQFVSVLKERFPQIEVRDCSPLIWELRVIKSPAEIDLLRRPRASECRHTRNCSVRCAQVFTNMSFPRRSIISARRAERRRAPTA